MQLRTSMQEKTSPLDRENRKAAAAPKILKAGSFIAVIKKFSVNKGCILSSLQVYPVETKRYVSSDDNRMELVFSLRGEEKETAKHGRTARSGRFILGDDFEWQDGSDPKNMANAVLVDYDVAAPSIKVLSSIVGLPPLYIYQVAGMVILTSDVYLIARVPGVNLSFDSAGLRDLCLIGHPVDHRTLFKDVVMIPGGHSIAVNAEGGVSMRRSWSLTEAEPLRDWNEYIELQVEAFHDAIQRMNLAGSFLSLTAGLDTRAILAGLIRMNKKIATYTVSGERMSLDARTAAHLCKKYGVQHTVVVLDDNFHKSLPDLAWEASRLSGGIASLAQSHEVYFYKKIGNHARARLCGNLGNQVCRRGVEKVSLRRADPSLLREAGADNNGKENSHWYDHAEVKDAGLNYEFLLQQEVPFSSVSNYSLGNHFTVQQTPYASRRLIETLGRRPRTLQPRANSHSLLQMRLHDLRHRFLGESQTRSFQVKYIKDTGGYVASCPVNWGWRPSGGVSLTGNLLGAFALVDAFVNQQGLYEGILYKGLRTIRIAGLHEFVVSKIWLMRLRDFVYNTLLSQTVKQSGLFNEKKLTAMLHEHFSSKRCYYKTVLLALDLALAMHIFKAKAAESA